MGGKHIFFARLFDEVMTFFGRFYDGVMTFFGQFHEGSWLFLDRSFDRVMTLFDQVKLDIVDSWPGFRTGSWLFRPVFRRVHDFYQSVFRWGYISGRKTNPSDHVSWLTLGSPLEGYAKSGGPPQIFSWLGADVQILIKLSIFGWLWEIWVGRFQKLWWGYTLLEKEIFSVSAYFSLIERQCEHSGWTLKDLTHGRTKQFGGT